MSCSIIESMPLAKQQETTLLFRPVGKKEFELIEETGFKKFPPRLFHQPFFYPVSNKEYAEQIARDWNTKDVNSDFIGYVTQFHVRSELLSRYELKTVGKRSLHEEYWIPADDLELFNENIVGKIEIVSTFQAP
jgi:hypothetical protein